MPNLFSNLRECFGFSQIIKSLLLSASIALEDMSPKFPIGVATMYMPKSILFISCLFVFIISCTPINLPKQSQQSKSKDTKEEQSVFKKSETTTKVDINKTDTDKVQYINKIDLDKNITVLFSKKDNKSFTKQFVDILEMATYNKNLDNASFEIKYFENDEELENIILKTKKEGKIFIGPLGTSNTKIAKKFCNDKIIFFAFSPDTSLANDCVYLINFFPKNELEQLFSYLNNQSKVALLYPENNYGYTVNLLIDDIVNKSNAILVNRASYKKDLSNVRDAIKELGKYELRKYELERQKKLLSSKTDNESKLRLKKLEKFKTTNDYDFTHILIADYGINLLQVAPLLPYYDIDPKVVQFISTGVIDDENFFTEPSLQGAIFPGIEKNKRMKLLKQYKEIYNENLLRISTLPYDLVGLLNYIYSRNLSFNKFTEILNNPTIKFNGVDGSFYFKQNMIERNLDILKISNGAAIKIN